MKRICILFVILSLNFLRIADAKDPLELVVVDLKGTEIDVLPMAITVFTDEVDKAMESLLLEGANIFEKSKNSVSYRGVFYQFQNPNQEDQTEDSKSFSPANGDVIYVFRIESESKRVQFLNKYDLGDYIEVKDSDGGKTKMYKASPSYYVVLVP